MRESAGRTAHGYDEAGRKTAFSTYAHEEPFRRLQERQGLLESNAGIKQGNIAAQTGWRRMGIESMAQENDARKDILDAGTKFATAFGGGGFGGG
jgi:hypothetical protein